MSFALTLLAVLVGAGLIFIISKAMKNKKMDEFQAIAWLVGAVGIIVLGLFPQIITWVAEILGVWWAPAVLIFFLLVVMFFIVFRHAQSISVLTTQMMEASMQLTLLKKENGTLKEQLANRELSSGGGGTT